MKTDLSKASLFTRGKTFLGKSVARNVSPWIPRWHPKSCSLGKIGERSSAVAESFLVDHGRAVEVKWTEFSDSPLDRAPETRRAYRASDNLYGYLVQRCALHVPSGYAFLAETVIVESRGRPGPVPHAVALEGASGRLPRLKQNRDGREILESDIPKIYVRNGGNNFYHFLLEEMPKLLRAIQEFGDIAVILPDDSAGWVKAEVDRFVPDSLQVCLSRTVVEVNNLVIIDCNPWRPPGELPLSVLRSAYLGGESVGQSAVQTEQPLYISRRMSRRTFESEEQVERILESRGFRTLLPSAFSNLIMSAAQFSAARMVIGPYGAGMAGLSFCNSGASVLEIVVNKFHNPQYAELSTNLGLVHNVLKVDSQSVGRIPELLPEIIDFIDFGSGEGMPSVKDSG